ncbi:bifunctional riboflavin kinase/FAD synthetase [Sphingomonas astaxanthinifaciens]|uniref:Riboflavin biosynthesis protein n=1 Tax=Sphingomonas astaxanthinifaciens DSM 22298 TaxID=1123267 RepID=A0ABQ5Z8W1_9SPHN|nr:bifunctional riboflavin kinase/FAD synthetase [Sphingomonas astaxanthinifaciens]GLR47298.1 riboflavin biosynthesis protein [Sphingomonas astaxanthinifaciens DSM 22298]
MKRLSLRDGIPDSFRDSVVALGNFDGFHLGHQAVVGRAVARAAHGGRPALVATFDPHPVRFFKPDAAPFRLTSLDQRAELFAAAGADACLVFDFDAALAATSAEDFVAMLREQVGAAAVVTGEDFTFGARRGGNAAVLRAVGAAHGLAAEAVGPVADGDEAVSSSRIRRALAQGDTATATRLLTRPFAIRGTVQHGDKRGRELGYPTANMVLADYQRPAYGIYAVTVRLPDGREQAGVANVGVRPTFEPPVELLETYLFDWSGDLYGQEIEVALRHFLRPERRFEDMDSLAEQMRRDEAEARALLQP